MRGPALAVVLAAALAVAVVLAAPALGAAGDAVTARVRWLRDLWAALGTELPQLSTEARVLALAHATMESGWGVTRQAREAYNVWNLTAGSAWRGPTMAGGDTEYDAQGNVRPITQAWRVYGSMGAAVRDYWAFLGPTANRGRYVAARAALERGDAVAFAQELYRAGYYTLPPARYAEQLGAVVRSVSAALA